MINSLKLLYTFLSNQYPGHFTLLFHLFTITHKHHDLAISEYLLFINKVIY